MQQQLLLETPKCLKFCFMQQQLLLYRSHKLVEKVCFMQQQLLLETPKCLKYRSHKLVEKVCFMQQQLLLETQNA